MPRAIRALALVFVLAGCATDALAQAAVDYRLSFPEREHRLMDVQVTFSDLPDGPLQLRMSRSSPGRYALHEFAKNVHDVRATDAAGKVLTIVRRSPQQWEVTGHRGQVRVSYRVFGDRTDGTYLAVDSTHAHINMPAALMWARGLELRPATVRFDVPSSSSWRVATQLLPGSDPLTFTAPNLQYLMDSPSEVSGFALRTFTVPDNGRTPTFRLAVHHTGTDAQLDTFARDVEAIVREHRQVFGEFPEFEGGQYTFIADYLPWVNGDGMEHRNSTIVTSPSSIQAGRLDLLSTISHEFFHVWNVERIRPRSLEPFNFEDVNMSGELWLAEGFTNYYGPLVMQRAGLTPISEFAQDMGRAVNTVLTSPGRQLRSAEEMSQFAPFVDAAAAIDRTSFENTYISYYTWGSTIALGLDLSLRDRSDGRVTLDHFMRALWVKFGKPGGQPIGFVANPYTADDVKNVLAAVSGDEAFAREFFSRYVQGRDVPDYKRLLARAGFVMRPVAPGRAFAGALRFQDAAEGLRITSPVPFGSPAYRSGLERDDVIVSIDDRPIKNASDYRNAISQREPGEQVRVTFLRRLERVSATVQLIEDSSTEIVPVEETGASLTAAQQRFRDQWLSSVAVLATR